MSVCRFYFVNLKVCCSFLIFRSVTRSLTRPIVAFRLSENNLWKCKDNWGYQWIPRGSLGYWNLKNLLHTIISREKWRWRKQNEYNWENSVQKANRRADKETLTSSSFWIFTANILPQEYLNLNFDSIQFCEKLHYYSCGELEDAGNIDI